MLVIREQETGQRKKHSFNLCRVMPYPQGWGRASLVAVASRECCDLSRGREAFSHHKYIQEGERHMLGIVSRTRGCIGKEL